jgi:hypothetical protein
VCVPMCACASSAGQCGRAPSLATGPVCVYVCACVCACGGSACRGGRHAHAPCAAVADAAAEKWGVVKKRAFLSSGTLLSRQPQHHLFHFWPSPLLGRRAALVRSHDSTWLRRCGHRSDADTASNDSATLRAGRYWLESKIVKWWGLNQFEELSVSRPSVWAGGPTRATHEIPRPLPLFLCCSRFPFEKKNRWAGRRGFGWDGTTNNVEGPGRDKPRLTPWMWVGGEGFSSSISMPVGDCTGAFPHSPVAPYAAVSTAHPACFLSSPLFAPTPLRLCRVSVIRACPLPRAAPFESGCGRWGLWSGDRANLTEVPPIAPRLLITIKVLLFCRTRHLQALEAGVGSHVDASDSLPQAS